MWKNDQLIGENSVKADHVKITNALFINIFIARKLVKITLEVANFGHCFTVNHDELGNLGLTVAEEKAIVAFLKTLIDDYPVWGQDKRVPPGTPAPF